MPHTKFLLCLLTFFTLLAVSAAPDTSKWEKGPSKGWHLTLESAQKAASGSSKKIYVLFTGSDWCGFCIKLKKEVLSSGRFKSYARKNLELVYIDFPRKKKGMPDEQRQYNTDLRKKLGGGGGVPAALILDAEGNVLNKIVGYRPLKRYMEALQQSAASPRNAGTPSAPDAKADSPFRNWHTSLEKALEKAKAQNKLVLVLKTGSDWCPPCMRMEREVLSSAEFKNLAEKHFELVCLDFPKKKFISPEQRQYNNQISQKLKMGRGVPSIVILAPGDEKPLAVQSGYRNRETLMGFLKKAAAAQGSPAESSSRSPAPARGNWNAADLLQDIQLSITKWSDSYEGASTGRNSLPAVWESGKTFFVKINYEFPDGVRGRVLLRAPGVDAAPSPLLSGRGITIISGSFKTTGEHRTLELAFQPSNDKKIHSLQHLPCSIKVTKR